MPSLPSIQARSTTPTCECEDQTEWLSSAGAPALRRVRSWYVCPHPTNRMGAPLVYVIDSAAPTTVRWRSGGQPA